MAVGIIDIGLGNIGSLANALHSQGWDYVNIAKPCELGHVTHLILPGVGAYNAAIKLLKNSDLFEAIQCFANEGRPIMGICLGMQLLADRGSEGGDIEGLGLIPGHVELLKSPNIRLPHVGWNNVHQLRNHMVLQNIRNNVDFYFVHSYRFLADSNDSILAETEYDLAFASIIARENVIGVQFHPEKSQANGLRILDNFCSL